MQEYLPELREVVVILENRSTYALSEDEAVPIQEAQQLLKTVEDALAASRARFWPAWDHEQACLLVQDHLQRLLHALWKIELSIQEASTTEGSMVRSHRFAVNTGIAVHMENVLRLPHG